MAFDGYQYVHSVYEDISSLEFFISLFIWIFKKALITRGGTMRHGGVGSSHWPNPLTGCTPVMQPRAGVVLRPSLRNPDTAIQALHPWLLRAGGHGSPRASELPITDDRSELPGRSQRKGKCDRPRGASQSGEKTRDGLEARQEIKRYRAASGGGCLASNQLLILRYLYSTW